MAETAIERFKQPILWFVRPDHILIYVTILATMPYYLQPPVPGPSAALLDFVVSSARYMIGVWPWLVERPIHLVASIPGFLVLVSKVARPPPV